MPQSARIRLRTAALEYGVGWRRALKTLRPEQRFHLFQCGVYNVCGLFQEEDVDEDTLTTDTLSPDASHSSNSCSTQVSAATATARARPVPEPEPCVLPHIPNIPNIPSCAWNVRVQVEALLQEVQQLREELRSRDQTILQLNRQLVRSLKLLALAGCHRRSPPERLGAEVFLRL